MWLEIRPEREAAREARATLEPEARKFEIRVICWKPRDVPPGSRLLRGVLGRRRQKQCTDIHWRCRQGRASWNWRLKFPLELPLASPELGRLNVQLWDKDIIKWNDIIGQSQLDLYRWLLKAYRENRSVNVFKEINDAIERKKQEEMGLATGSDLEDDSDDDGSATTAAPATTRRRRRRRRREKPVGGDGDGGDARPPPRTAARRPGGRRRGAAGRRRAARRRRRRKGKKGDDDDDDEPEEKVATQDEMAEKDAEFFVKQLKNLMGLPLDESGGSR